MSKRNYHTPSVYVDENLASADPFYRGPHAGTPPPPDEAIRPLDLNKTERDIGRRDEPADDIPDEMMPTQDSEAKREKL